jgi:hypothetical protein
MKVVLVLVVGAVVLFAALALVELLRAAAGRLLGPRRARRRGRGRPSAGVWANVREARRDTEALRSRPDLDAAWTSWERRERQGP